MIQFNSNLMQPKDTYSCGAYCILSSLKALDLIPVEEIVKLDYYSRKTQINKNDALIDIIDKIYSISGYMKPNGEYTKVGGYYSAISSIVYILNKFKCKVGIKLTLQGLNFIKNNFKLEEQKIKKEQYFHYLDIIRDYEKPKENQIQIGLVNMKEGGLHWIARDGSGLYYDSDIGTNNNNWGDFLEGINNKYEWIGAWILLEK